MKMKIHIPDQEHIRMMRSKGMSEKDAVMKMAMMKRMKGKKKVGKHSELDQDCGLQDQ